MKRKVVFVLAKPEHDGVKYLSYIPFGSDSEKDRYWPLKYQDFARTLYNPVTRREILFSSEREAEKYLRDHREYMPDFGNGYGVFVESELVLPKCNDANCWVCNKKNKMHCKKLQNDYQAVCPIQMGRFDDDFVLDSGRLDAPCERCKSSACWYYQGR